MKHKRNTSVHSDTTPHHRSTGIINPSTNWFHPVLTALLVFWQTMVQLRIVHAEPMSRDANACDRSLLLDRYRIPFSAFTATSEQIDPTGSRRYAAEAIRTEHTDSAWCPRNRIGPELSEFVQVDMGELNVITKFVISGLLVDGGGARFSPHFYIRYKREHTESEWRTYRQIRPVKTSQLLGSTSALVPKFVVLDPPLIARWIRIYPYRDSPGFVCIRLEAYGCRFSDDLVEYQIPEGSVAFPPYQAPPFSDVLVKPTKDRPGDNHTLYYQAGGSGAFSDVSYDGYRIEPGGLLDGGLGCLTDLAIAPQNSAPSPLLSAVSGAHDEKLEDVNRWFVGWHRNRWVSSTDKPNEDVVDMLFRFATIRSFKRLQIYVSNNYRQKIRLPRRIEVRFSVGGVLFSGQPVIAQDFLPNNKTTGVMNIELDLAGRIGRVVQLKAFFSDDWMLFSEVKFFSQSSTDPVLIDESTGPRRSKKDPSPPTGTEATMNALSTDFVDFSSRHLPTVIILAVLIVAFLVIIGFTCLRLIWKRRQWHVVKRIHGDRHVTTRIVPESGGYNNPSLFSSNGRTLKNPNELSVITSQLGSEVEPFSRLSDSQDCEKKSSSSCFGLLCRRTSPSRRVGRQPPTIIRGSTASSLPANSAYSFSTNQPVLTNCGLSASNHPQNGHAGLSFNCNGHFGQILPTNLPNDFLSNEIVCSEPSILTADGRIQSLDSQLKSDWLIRSGYSNSTTNSTGASVVVSGVNPEVNLYTTVGGESDGDSNGASTMSPEYASANPRWTSTLSAAQTKVLRQPVNNTLQHFNGLPGHIAIPTSMTFSGVRTLAPTGPIYPGPPLPGSITSPPLIYYNPTVSNFARPTDVVPFSDNFSQGLPSGIYIPQLASIMGPTVIDFGHTMGSRGLATSMSTTTISSPNTQDGTVLHLPPGNPTSFLKQEGLYCAPNDANLFPTSPGAPQQRPVIGDSGPWIKVNRYDGGMSDGVCPPIPSTPPPPPPNNSNLLS